MPADESAIRTELKAGRLRRAYYLYGKEDFLTRTYSDRIVEAAVGKDPFDMNLIRLSGVPDIETLSNHIDGVPVFSDRKVIVINDLDAEKTDNDTIEALCGIFEGIPEETVLVIEITGFQPDTKKAKTKKLMGAVDKVGLSVEFESMTPARVTELIIKKASKAGISISRENAGIIGERALYSLTLIGAETDKLFAYIGKGGTVSKETVELLVAKQLDTSIYELASSITAGKPKESFRILDELVSRNVQPVVIMSALSATFVDFYRAKLAKSSGRTQNDVVKDFSYPKNRAWVVGKAMTAVSRMEMPYLRRAVQLLSEADIALKSSPVQSRIIMEQTVGKLIAGKS